MLFFASPNKEHREIATLIYNIFMNMDGISDSIAYLFDANNLTSLV